MTRDLRDGLLKELRVYSSRCQVTSDNHLSLACGPCSADQVRCFSPGWIFRGTQRVRNDDVWSSGQVCPLLERKCPQDQLITESRAQFTLCLIPPSWHPFHRDLCLEVPSLATLTLSLSFAYILLGFSAPTVLLKSPGSTASSWRLLWMWSSKILLTGDHQEEHRMCSCYSDASYSKSPLGIRVTHFCLNSILPCTSFPTRCKEEGKTNLTTWHFSLNISCNCSIRLCPPFRHWQVIFLRQVPLS